MKKIPTLFQRDPDTNRRYVTRDVTPGCEWVLAGEGVATFKWDGTSVLIDEDDNVWKRRELKPGQAPPDGFREEGFDDVTGKTVGWVPCRRVEPGDRWHWEAVDSSAYLAPGTYELIGPKVQGNPHGVDTHMLMLHGAAKVHEADGATSYDDLLDAMRTYSVTGRLAGLEGVVWHHPDGRMAKLKVKDLRELS